MNKLLLLFVSLLCLISFCVASIVSVSVDVEVDSQYDMNHHHDKHHNIHQVKNQLNEAEADLDEVSFIDRTVHHDDSPAAIRRSILDLKKFTAQHAHEDMILEATQNLGLASPDLHEELHKGTRHSTTTTTDSHTFCVPAKKRTVTWGNRMGGEFLSHDYAPTKELDLSRAADELPTAKSFLWYKSWGAPIDSLEALFNDAEKDGVTVQIGFEPSKGSDTYDLKRIIASLSAKSGEIYEELHNWAKFFASRKPHKVYLRPLSEMNDNGSDYELGGTIAIKTGNNYKLFAETWCLMHAVFDEVDATNVLFMFDVFEGANKPTLGSIISKVLHLIPSDQIDALGIHPYSRKHNGNSRPIPFANLVDPWISLYKSVPGYNNKPFVIGEMGVSDNVLTSSAGSEKNKAHDTVPAVWDQFRADWITQAYAHAKKSNFVLVTYFNQQNTNWRVTTGSKAHQALIQAIKDFQN